MNAKFLILAFMMLGVISACSTMNPQYVDTNQASQSVGGTIDHNALAQQYDQEAANMQTKVEETKQQLSQYENNSYLYGRQAEDLKEHTQRLLHDYEKAVTNNKRLAQLQRSIK